MDDEIKTLAARWVSFDRAIDTAKAEASIAQQRIDTLTLVLNNIAMQLRETCGSNIQARVVVLEDAVVKITAHHVIMADHVTR